MSFGHEPVHYHSHGPDDAPAMMTSTLMAVIAVIAALVLIGLVAAWSPWSDGTRGNAPGQGGEDERPGIEQRVPQPDTQPVSPR